MNIRKALCSLFLASVASLLASFVILLPGLVWPDSMILFGLLALILYLYVTLPLHGFTFVTLLYASFRYSVFTQVLGYYSYFVIWAGVNALVFQDFLFVEVPEKFEDWYYEYKHEDELALIRGYQYGHQHGTGSTDSARELLAKGVDPNLTDKNSGISVLSWASLRATEADVQLLIDAGANINHQTAIQFGGGPNSHVQLSLATPLSLASLNNNQQQRYRISTLLSKSGADPRVGEPALGACGYDDIPLLEHLVEAGADLWVRDTRNRGCLYYAANAGYETLTQYLLDQRIKGELAIDPLDQKITPNLVDIAATRGHADVVIRLFGAGYRASQPQRLERLLHNQQLSAESKRQIAAILQAHRQAEPKE